jgi:DeoR/GlpR family transcriptional regulator of sugar metabolism
MKKEYNLKEMEILDYVQRNHMITTAEAVELTNASESTVRRIFIKLQKDGRVERIFGGIKKIQELETYHYHEIVTTNVEQKREIGEIAAQLVDSNEFIYIDCGTTTRQMCEALADRVKSGEIQNIVVVTNSVINLEILGACCEVIIVGGRYSTDRKDVSGNLSETFLEHFRFHKSFLGTDGFSFEQGFTSTSATVSLLGKAVSRLSEQSFVLMDASKIGKVAAGITCRLENVDGIITDSAISQENLDRFAEHKMKVFVKK